VSLRAAGWSGAKGSKRGRWRLAGLPAMVGARGGVCGREAEGDGRGWLAKHTGQAGFPPSDSSPTKFSDFDFARFCTEGV
jgi:hypothetical protein